MSMIKNHIHSNEDDMEDTLLEYQLECYYEEMKEKYETEEKIETLLEYFYPLMEEEK